MLSRALARQLEGEAMDALDAAAREGGHLQCHFVVQAGVHTATGAGVFAFGVLAHDDPVDAVSVFHGAAHARQHARGSHVGVLIEALADRQAQSPERDMVGHIGRTDGAEENGVEALELFQPAFGNVAPGLLVELRAPVEVLELEAEVAGDGLQQLDAGGGHPLSDNLARGRGGPGKLYAATFGCARTASATPAPTSGVLALALLFRACGAALITRSLGR